MLKISLQMLQIMFLPGSICEELLQGPARHQVGGKRQDEDIIAAVRLVSVNFPHAFSGFLFFFVALFVSCWSWKSSSVFSIVRSVIKKIK